MQFKSYKKVLSTSIVLLFTFSLLILSIQPVLGVTEVTIFSENFEGVFPDDNGWIVGDLTTDSGEDYWGATGYKAHSGSKSGWCARIGTKSVPTEIFSEGFESGFGNGINGWSVGDSNPSGTTAYWNDVSSAFGGEGTHSGNYKAYCAGFNYGGTFSSPTYQNYMDAYMTRTVNLIGYNDAYVQFYYKMPSLDILDTTVYDYGQLKIGTIELRRYDTVKTSWTFSRVYLTGYAGGVFDLTWNFHSDPVLVYEGWYIDDIKIVGFSTEDNTALHQYDNYMDAYMMRQIDLTDYVSATLSYYYWLDSETDYDYLFVQTSTDGSIWNTEKYYTGYSDGWAQDTVDLTPYAGANVYIRFLFFSDEIISDYEGAYLDDIIITAVPHDDANTGGDAGDDFDNATEITPGIYEGFVTPFDENDFYKIFVSAGNTIHIRMAPSELMNFDLALYDPNRQLVGESTNSGDAEENISYTAEVSGNHFILVIFISDKPSLYNYTLQITIEDNIPPTISITSPTNGTEIKSSNVQVTWTGSDADTGIDHYEVKLDDGSWINVGTDTSHTFSGVSDGSHIVYVKAVDGADNSKIALVDFTVNTSLLLGPGWMDDIIIFAIIIVIVAIIAAVVLVRRRKPPLPPPPH
ncbi:MAG: Ig-like domain-containing protein [Nitrososphaerales archaeon]